MKNFLYNKKTILGLRIFSAIAIFILIVVNVLTFVSGEIFLDGAININRLNTVVINFFTIVIAVFVLFFPQKFGLIAVACFLYMIKIFVWDKGNPMGIMMASLQICILYVRGFFMKHKGPKIAILSTILIALQCSRLRFGAEVLFRDLVMDMGYSFVFFFAVFFIVGFESRNRSTEKILNLALYDGLKESDVDLLNCVLNNQQYKVIAINMNKSEGAVRNRLNKIYDAIGVLDRIGFLTTFTGFDVIFKPIEQHV